MRTGHVARSADSTDELSNLNMLADPGVDAGEVRVPGLNSIHVSDGDLPAKPAIPPCEHDSA
jgi:hypothetical protein